MSEERYFSDKEIGKLFENFKWYFRENLDKNFAEIRNFIHSNGDRFRTPSGTIVTKYSDIYCLIDYPFILIAKGWGKFNFLGLDCLCTDLDTADSEDILDFMQFFSGDPEEWEEKLISQENPLKLVC